MTRFEQLEQLAADSGLRVDEGVLEPHDPMDGLFVNGKNGGGLILVNRHRTLAQRTAALAEELGHFFKSIGDLRDLNDIMAAKQERLGRAWGYEQQLPPPLMEEHLMNGGGTAWEVAEETDLPQPFVEEAYRHYVRRDRLALGKELPPEIQEAFQRALQRSLEERPLLALKMDPPARATPRPAGATSPDPPPPAPSPRTPAQEAPLPPPPPPGPRRRVFRVRLKPRPAPPTPEEGLALSPFLKDDAERFFGVSGDDPRWESIIYAMLLTGSSDPLPDKRVTRNYYFPPVRVSRGRLFQARSSVVFGAREQRSFLAPFNRNV